MTEPKTDAPSTAKTPPVRAPLAAPAAESAPPKQARRSGGGMATFAAVVALAAAGVSIAGPSLRPYMAEQLTARFGNHAVIGILTGTAEPEPKSRIDVDLAAFDHRVAALAQALGQAPGETAADPATLAALLKTLGTPVSAEGPSPEARKLAEVESRLAALTTRLDTLDQRAGEAEAGVGKGREAAGELAARLSAVEQAAATQAQRTDSLDHALGEGLAAVRQQGEADLAPLAARIDAAEHRTATLEERGLHSADRAQSRADAAALLTLVTRIRQAVEASEAFALEVAAAATLVGADPAARGAIEALNAVAAEGVPTLIRLQRTLAPLLADIVESERAAGPSWYARVTSTLGLSQAPPPSRVDSLSERVDGIARDMRAGHLANALWKLRALDTPLGGGVQKWIVEAGKRTTADHALGVLAELALRRTQDTAP